VQNVYVGTPESSILNVYLGSVAAGGSWPNSWSAFVLEHPEKARELEVKWETPSLVSLAFLVRDDVPPQLAEHVAAAIFSLNTTEAGQMILKNLARTAFDPANDRSYDVVREFLDNYSKFISPIEH
jgi:phosphonate transport system substrate-binding protein